MKNKREPRQYIPVAVEGEDFIDFMLPAIIPAVKALFSTAEYLGRDPRNLLEESIVKLFKEAFDIDIKTCTEEEWTERITMKGGALKQWQSLLA